jgi:hypothetical protein
LIDLLAFRITEHHQGQLLFWVLLIKQGLLSDAERSKSIKVSNYS